MSSTSRNYKQEPGNVTKHLMKKAEAIKKSAELIASTTNDWQVIKAYLSNRIQNLELTPMQQKKLDRYQFVYNQMSSGRHLEKEVVEQLITTYGIQYRQAMEDLHDAKELYAFLFNINKLFELRMQLDLNKIELQKASEANDTRGYAAIEKNRIKLLEMVKEAESFPAENFEPHKIIIQFNPELLGAKPIDPAEVWNIINEKRKQRLKTDNIQEAEVVNARS